MKNYLYLLEPREGGLYPWRYQNDTLQAIVVAAPNPTSARRLAAASARSEGRHVWLDIEITSCEEIATSGAPRVILRDYT